MIFKVVYFKDLCSSGWDIAFGFLELESELTVRVLCVSCINSFTLTTVSRVGCPLPVCQVGI